MFFFTLGMPYSVTKEVEPIEFLIHMSAISVRYFTTHILKGSGWDSAVGTAAGYGLDDRGVEVRVLVGSRIFSSSHCPDRLWGPPSLLSNGYQG
jgi:hypothetical protein